jgi:hypothetical protein
MSAALPRIPESLVENLRKIVTRKIVFIIVLYSFRITVKYHYIIVVFWREIGKIHDNPI